MPAKSICGGPITTRLLILCIFIGILCALCASLFCVQRGKKAIRFGKGAKKKAVRFGIPIGHFPSDGAASMAVKGLRGLFALHACGPC